jgi:hypothetical protein
MRRATKAKGLPVNPEPFAEFFHIFLRPALRTVGPTGLAAGPERNDRRQHAHQAGAALMTPIAV